MIGNAVRVMRIATGEESDDVQDDGKDPAAKALGAKGGKKPAPITGQRFANVGQLSPACHSGLTTLRRSKSSTSEGLMRRSLPNLK
ncbi:hypothetical protein [Mesorhizobium sp. M0578]|uniref:hypothetical protein n=1 Tax=Mesorhizobium sp. M0578 TaxID=2956961 RepID=UPI00333C2B35